MKIFNAFLLGLIVGAVVVGIWFTADPQMGYNLRRTKLGKAVFGEPKAACGQAIEPLKNCAGLANEQAESYNLASAF